MGDVWEIMPSQSREGHPAPFSDDLVAKCVSSGSDEGDILFDPFGGMNTVGKHALKNGRKSIVMELFPQFCEAAFNSGVDANKEEPTLF
jgi:site-specific DNA-methyltransferase (adenine-specific)